MLESDIHPYPLLINHSEAKPMECVPREMVTFSCWSWLIFCVHVPMYMGGCHSCSSFRWAQQVRRYVFRWEDKLL